MFHDYTVSDKNLPWFYFRISCAFMPKSCCVLTLNLFYYYILKFNCTIEYQLFPQLWKGIWPYLLKLTKYPSYDPGILFLWKLHRHWVYMSRQWLECAWNFVHNCPQMEITKMSIIRRMGKEIVVQSYKGILYSKMIWFLWEIFWE